MSITSFLWRITDISICSSIHRQAIPLYRITNGTWDDITPAISPDGKRIAFSSRRNGYFDIYILDLETGELSRVTDSLSYDASPSWSPDGQWIVYETYENGNMDIRISSAVTQLRLQSN